MILRARTRELLLNALIGFYVLFAAAIIRLAFKQSLQPTRSQDFQWSGAHMVLNHIDPWKQFLSGDREHLIKLLQLPNYLHETYLLLLPFGMMSFAHARVAWDATNLMMAIVSLFILARFFALSKKMTLLLTCFFFTSYSFRISFGNGQQNFMELLAFSVAFCLSPVAVRGIALGISYVKYNFSPIFFFYLLFRKQFRILAISLLPPLVGLVAIWALVHTPILKLAIEPFLVSRTGIIVTAADTMALTRWLGSYVLPARPVEILSYLVGISASLLYGLHLARRHDLSPQALTTLLATSTIVLMRHGHYDFFFLIVAVANTKYLQGLWPKCWTLGTVALFWYGERFDNVPSVNFALVVKLVLVAILLFLVESNPGSLADRESIATSQKETPSFEALPQN